MPVNLACKVLVDGTGLGAGPWVEVTSVSSPNALELALYDPNGCYNVLCTSSDSIISMHIEWFGSFTTSKATDKFRSWKAPYYLSGYANGNGCTNFGPSCADLDLTVQSRRAPPPGMAVTADYICSEVDITCKNPCYDCKGDLVDKVSCPVGPQDCTCPPNTKPNPLDPTKCDGCITCPGDLIPRPGVTVCPIKRSDCKCPGNLQPLYPGSTECGCPAGTKPSPTKPDMCDPCIVCAGDLVPKENVDVCPVKTTECECPGDLEPTPDDPNTCACQPKRCDGKDLKYSMFRYKEKDDKCEQQCVPTKDVAKKESEGYSFCPCKTIPPPDVPPKPESCVLKRGAQLLKFERNYPALEKDVYIEVYVVKTQNIYQFKNFDTSLPEITIEDQAIFLEMKFGEELWCVQSSRRSELASCYGTLIFLFLTEPPRCCLGSGLSALADPVDGIHADTVPLALISMAAVPWSVLRVSSTLTSPETAI